MDTTEQPYRKITKLLNRWHDGDDEAMNELMPLVYDKLYAQARFYVNKERDHHTISSTALVNEAYLEMVDEREREWQSCAHFFAVAARIMQNFLIKYAQARKTQKRGGGHILVPGNHLDHLPTPTGEKLFSLNEELEWLEKRDAKKAMILKMRFFLGMTIKEIAETINISPATVKRELQFAKAWLRKFLRRS